MLHDDPETHDRLSIAFTQRFPLKALDRYRRSMMASARHEAQQAVNRDQVRRINESARADADYIAALEREERHYGATPERTARVERARKSRVEKLRDATARRNAPVEPNQPYETLAEQVLESKGTFVAVDVGLKLPKGQTLPEGLLSVREEIAECGRDIRRASTAPLPAADWRKQTAEEVQHRARAVDASMTARIAPEAFGLRGVAISQGHVKFPSLLVAQDGGGSVEVGDGVGLLCWLFGDQIIAKATADVERALAESGKKPLSLAERTRVIADAEARKLDAERREARIIEALEDAGHLVYRRPLADWRAVLGIKPRD